MEPQLEQIREQQKQSWNKFSPGWKKWDTLVMKFMRPMADAIIDHLQLKSTDHVLDIAAGTGEPGLTIAGLVKEGTVVGTDLSDKMLLIADANAAERGLKNYTTKAADVCELPFEDNTFDAISCRMGFMFFPDMQLAANEMYRVLKPGGRIATSVWAGPDQNFWVTSIMGVISKYVEMPPPVPGAPGMFRCGKPGLIADLFARSGFKNVAEQSIKGKADYDDADTYWQNMMDVAAPVIAVMDKSDDTTKAAIKNDVYEIINANIVNGHALLDFGAIIIYGEKSDR
ncbi:MAG TPA: methyltransferase domain-containing protein [Mucilaginibacter sp.]|nr:methyltransferase domain-containing protein [Mucilaginibacter sp.]